MTAAVEELIEKCERTRIIVVFKDPPRRLRINPMVLMRHYVGKHRGEN